MNSPIQNRPKITAVVPAFNEEATIGQVVSTLKKSPWLDEVIVVSDGSTDQTTELARAAGARVIVNEMNLGKGQTMLKGVAQTDAPIIAFFDADLKGLTVDHIERLISPVVSGEREMNVGLRDRGGLIMKLYKFLPLISGERVLCRTIIEKIDPLLMQGFMVEIAFNQCCRLHGLNFGSVPFNGVSIRRKCQKVGLWRGLLGYIKMTYQIVKAMILVRLKMKS